ncbi:PREDICTED: zinc-finger homeodomain protein 5 isoform X2 [Tarenaya hassleriana]|uniref:zinc-finger homeodomain protein 5 isoform X1 n=1 Tax=Tarenaya hassleriana TaxID=28532 RepID=UPI00053C268D|nr:PREDICTED: zinc-finger homeodomain protein 5 isoform X1 [Tarenaya hassleriana]XP_010539900.1 PREDICTED: zinc-finger homeodomain protein 5 isoform X2 [Tarenaya hassleriana]
MDIRSHDLIERRAEGNNNDSSHNNYNGNNTSVSCTTQTLDHHYHRQKSPSSLSLPGSNVAKTVRYRECLKNHAASVGGSVQDGCGEFMPGGEEGTIEALKCAACDCHRNFHRKEVDGGGGNRPYGSSAALRPPPAVGMSMMMSPLMVSPPASFHHRKYGMVTPMSVAYGGGGAESSSEDLNLYGQSSGEYGAAVGTQTQPPFSMTKKRFRTKFTSEQKERMMEFAEKLGWRMNKQDEEELERFCAEIGVKRQVFKVWMHNNKNNVKKQQSM